MQNRQQIQRLTTQALLIVIIVLQDLIPMIGNLPLGPLSITTLPITVGVVAVVWGPREGMVVGGVWGLLTWVRAFVYPSSPLAPLIFTNPLISFVPRLLIGLVARLGLYRPQKGGLTKFGGLLCRANGLGHQHRFGARRYLPVR